MVDVLRSSTKLKYGDVASITTTEKAVAMAFPELINHVSSESSGSRTESHASFLDLSNDSTYYGDAYFVSIAYDGSPSTVSVESSTGILIPPNSCDDASYSGADSVYTSSSYSKNENEAKFYSHGTNETIEGSNLRDQALLFPTPSAATVVTSKTASPSSSNEMATSEKSPELGVWEKVLLAVVALVIVSCCIVTTIFIVRFMKTKGIAASAKFISSSSLNNASIVPTIRTSNDERFNQIQDWLSGTFDAIPGTPQYDAVAWMANIDIPSILGNDIQKPSHMTDVNRTVNGESDLLIRITQRYALLVIYFAVIGIDNLALGGWASLTGARLPECIWPGITCYTDKSTNTTIVSGLDLNPTVGRVAGSLPTELGLLSNLGTLQTALCNTLIRHENLINIVRVLYFPYIYCILSTESLVLTDNSLTGALPSNLYSLSNLRTSAQFFV
jgi:hypothetical protein